jgi:hypothetical protein
MNHMRLGVGLHSLGLAERSLQLARDYARERLQGRNAAGAQRPIIEHTDVRRMLLTMKSLTQAARGLAYTAAATLDVAHSANDVARSGNDVAHSRTANERQAAAARRADLLTPVVKAWCSDVAVEVASLGVQIHGGMGFVDDAEISQVFRDARIGPIFEGTNYIQAQDLLGRKVIRDKGAALDELLAEIEKAARALPAAIDSGVSAPSSVSTPSGVGTPTGAAANPWVNLQLGLIDGCARLRAATADLIANSAHEPDLIGATAHHFLQWLGLLAGGWQLALVATRAAAESDTAAARATADMAAFYGAHVLPRTLAHEVTVRNGVEAVTKASAADL